MNRNFPDVLQINLVSEVAQEAFQNFSSTVENLYQTFSHYKLKGNVNRCLHCVTKEDNQLLHGKALRELMPEDLEKYGRKAITTWGDVDDFRYFLPRLLEFFPFVGTGHLCPEIVFGKIRLGNWREWPLIEQKAIEDYFAALWHLTISSIEPTPWTYSEDILCSIAQTTDDISPYLNRWQIGEDLISLQNLSEFIKLKCENIESRKVGAFWKKREDQWNQVIQWLTDSNTINYFEVKIEKYPDLQEILLEIITSIRNCFEDTNLLEPTQSSNI